MPLSALLPPRRVSTLPSTFVVGSHPLRHPDHQPAIWLAMLPGPLPLYDRLHVGAEIMLYNKCLTGWLRCEDAPMGTISHVQGIEGGWAILEVEFTDGDRERDIFLLCVPCTWVDPLQHWWGRFWALSWPHKSFPFTPAHLTNTWRLLNIGQPVAWFQSRLDPVAPRPRSMPSTDDYDLRVGLPSRRSAVTL